MGEVQVIKATNNADNPVLGFNVEGIEAGDRATSKLRVAAYCRVSTEQEEQQGSFENQVTTYKTKIEANPDWEFAGIYADDGISGTRADHRTGFMKMLEDCKAGKIDMILTKSISRFSRNVIDSLKYTRELKEMGISIEFEEEHINSMDQGAEMIFTILSAVAEQEARNISEHTKWGLRSNFRRGIYRTPDALQMYGFTTGDDGKTAIVPEEAETVKMIYKNYLEGMCMCEIANNLTDMGVLGKKGCKVWKPSIIKSILTNEKYKGDVIMQKTYVADFMEHKTVKNNGELDKYIIMDAHPAIVDRESWDAVQLEMERRRKMGDPSGTASTMNSKNPYTGKIFYKDGCKALLSLHSYGPAHNGQGTWKCRYFHPGYNCVCHNPACVNGNMDNIWLDGKVRRPGTSDSNDTGLPPCLGFPVNNKLVRQMFINAWNQLIDHDIKGKRATWTTIANSKDSDALMKVRAKQMLELTANGKDSKIKEDVFEMVRLVLQRIEIEDMLTADVYFLDGSMEHVKLADIYDWRERDFV